MELVPQEGVGVRLVDGGARMLLRGSMGTFACEGVATSNKNWVIILANEWMGDCSIWDTIVIIGIFVSSKCNPIGTIVGSPTCGDEIWNGGELLGHALILLHQIFDSSFGGQFVKVVNSQTLRMAHNLSNFIGYKLPLLPIGSKYVIGSCQNLVGVGMMGLPF